MMQIRQAVLVYQAGIANVFRVDNDDMSLPDMGRNARRLLQGSFRECEAYARGLRDAGVHVESATCNMAGDIANQPWSLDIESAPFSDLFHPVYSNAPEGSLNAKRMTP